MSESPIETRKALCHLWIKASDAEELEPCDDQGSWISQQCWDIVEVHPPDLLLALWALYESTLKLYGVGEDWGEIGLALERVEKLLYRVPADFDQKLIAAGKRLNGDGE